jgi:hypothetical protein
VAVKALRRGAFKGPIRMAINGLPAGVSAPANLVIPADKSELAVLIEASRRAAASAALITISGTAEVAGRPVTRLARAEAAGNLAPRAPEDNETTTLLVAITLKPPYKAEIVDKDTGRKVPRGSTFPADVAVERLEGFRGDITLRMASQQAYQVQGMTGRDVTVAANATRAVFPCYMPEWLETSRTSRMAIIAEAKVPDPCGNVRHCLVPVQGQVVMTLEGALLKISHEDREFVVTPGKSFSVRVHAARSPRLAGSVRLELAAPSASLWAKPASLEPGQTDADLVVHSAADNRLGGEQLLTIRATAFSGGLPIISETTVPVSFKPE